MKIGGKAEETGVNTVIPAFALFPKKKVFKSFPVSFSRPLTLLPNNKTLDWSKLKAFADEKLKVAEIMTFVFYSIENIVGKGENAGYSIFSFSHDVYKRPLSQGR